MEDAIWFGFSLIAMGMGIMGLFTIFTSIIGDKDEKVQQAFRDGFMAGVYKTEDQPKCQPRNSKELSKK